MSKFSVTITMTGDMGSIECAIDEIVMNIPCVDMDEVEVSIRNVGE